MRSLEFWGLVCALAVVAYVGGGWFRRSANYRNKDQPAPRTWLQLGLQLAYFLGLPYIVLIFGLIPARFFGLKGLTQIIIPPDAQSAGAVLRSFFSQFANMAFTWLPDIGLMAGAGAMLGGLFLLYTWLYMRGQFSLEQMEPSPATNSPPLSSSIYPSKLEAIFDVAHLSFYRAAVWFISDSLYLGVLGSLFLVLVEYLLLNLHPRTDFQVQNQTLFRYGLALIASILFLTIPNIWLNLVFHLAIIIAAEAMLRIGLNYYYRYEDNPVG